MLHNEARFMRVVMCNNLLVCHRTVHRRAPHQNIRCGALLIVKSLYAGLLPLQFVLLAFFHPVHHCSCQERGQIQTKGNQT